MSSDIDERHELFESNKERLKQLAYKGLSVRNMKAGDFIVVCIEVDDPVWTDIANCLMPNADWQQYRDRGEKPIARGILSAEICQYLGEDVPDIRDALLQELPDKGVRAVVMGSGGATVYIIEPIPESQHKRKLN